MRQAHHQCAGLEQHSDLYSTIYEVKIGFSLAKFVAVPALSCTKSGVH